MLMNQNKRCLADVNQAGENFFQMQFMEGMTLFRML